MDDDLLKILERATQACRTGKVHHQGTKNLCGTAIQALQTSSESRVHSVTAALNSCLTQEDTLVCIGLDGYDWLFAHGSLVEEGTDESLAVQAIESVLAAPCYTDEVRIRVVRTLLTAISTTPTLAKGSLRRTISVMLEFGLLPSLHLRTTARAALAQIIGVLQLRTEGSVQAECITSVISAISKHSPTLSTDADACASQSLLLLHNLFVATPSDSVFDHAMVREAIALDLFPFLASCCTNVSTAIHKASFFLVRHLIQRLRHLVLLQLFSFVQNIVISLLNVSWSGASIKEECANIITAILENETIVREVFSSFDCTAGQGNVLCQLLMSASKSTLTADEATREALLRAFHAFLRSVNVLLAADVGTEGENARDAIQEKRSLQILIESFNANPKEGVLIAAERGLLDKTDPVSIAKFLLATPALDKEKIGNYLGGAAEFAVSVLTAFVNQFDFRGLEIDEAMRSMLGRFKPVGEAAIVDRTMNAFAAHYLECNPTSFANHDAAHIVSFSLMMLNTDLHSKHVKDKMTFASFSSMLRGVNDGADFPVTYLEGIYERIKAREIKLNDSEEAPAAKPAEESDVFVSEKKRQLLAMKAEAEALVNRVRRPNLTMISVRRLLNVVPELWDGAWSAVLAALSSGTAVETTPGDVPPIMDSCLAGFRTAISIACRLAPSPHRDAFASTLANLARGSSPERSAKAFDSLLRSAIDNGEYLDKTWSIVVKAASDVERNRQIALNDSHMDASVEALFNHGATLSPRALEFFAGACLEASLSELLTPPAPRLMCFEQGLACLSRNKDRLDVVWSGLWPRFSAHFVAGASARHPEVPLLCLEQFRHLVLDLLQSPIVASRGWQAELLTPFQTIALKVRTFAIRDFVLDSMTQILQQMHSHLGESWLVLLGAIQQCANSSNRPIVEKAFAFTAEALSMPPVAQRLLHSPLVVTSLLHVLASFALNAHAPNVPEVALQLLWRVSLAVIRGVPRDINLFTTLPPFGQFALDAPKASVPCADEAEKHRLILCTLANVVSVLQSRQHQVAVTSVELLENLLFLPETESFSQELWKLIVGGVVCPIIDNVLADVEEARDLDTLSEVARLTLSLVVRLVSERPTRSLFPDLFGCAVRLAHSENESVSHIGASSMDAFCAARSTWATAAQVPYEIVASVVATELNDPKTLTVESHARFMATVAKDTSAHLSSPEHPLRSHAPALLDALWASTSWCRYTLDHIGDDHPPSVERLIDAQRALVLTAMSVIMSGASAGTTPLTEWVSSSVARIFDQSRRPHEANAMAGVVAEFLEKMSVAPDTVFDRLFHQLRTVLCDLILCCDIRIAKGLAPIFRRGTAPKA